MDMTDDEKLEKTVSNALSREPDYFLKANFADRIVNAIQARKEAQRDRWAIIIGLVGLVVALIFVVQQVEFKTPNFFSGYTGIVIFGMVFAVGLHFFDKLVLRKQESG